MKYSILGKTNLKVSRCGIGGHEFDWVNSGNLIDNRLLKSINPERVGMIDMAIANGINYFDVTFDAEVQSLGHCLKTLNKRKHVVVNGMAQSSLRFPDMHKRNIKKEMEKELDEKLRLLNSDYFDIFMICHMNLYDDWLVEEATAALMELKNTGKFRFAGVSNHSFKNLYEYIAKGHDIDVAMFWYNYAIHKGVKSYGHTVVEFDYMEKMFDILEKNNIGKVAMKPLTWYIRTLPFAFRDVDVDHQDIIADAIAWQVLESRTDTAVPGVDRLQHIKTIVEGSSRSSYDKQRLDSFITYEENEYPLIECLRKYDSMDNYTREKLRRYLIRQSGLDVNNGVQECIDKLIEMKANFIS